MSLPGQDFLILKDGRRLLHMRPPLGCPPQDSRPSLASRALWSRLRPTGLQDQLLWNCCPLCLAGGGLESGLWLSLAPETRGELAGAVGASSALKDTRTITLWVGGKPVAPNTTGDVLGVLRSPNSQTLKGLWKEELSN